MWAQYGIGLVALTPGSPGPRAPDAARAGARGSARRREFLTLFVPRVAAALGEAYHLDGRVPEKPSRSLQPPRWSRRYDAGHDGLLPRPLCRLPLSQGHLIAGRLDEAHAEAEASAELLARAHGEHGNEAYALRLLGEIHAHGDGDAAERSYRGALACATKLGMRPLLAHCHLGVGTLYRRAGKVPQAREHLLTAAAMYRSIDMLFWLQQAERESAG